MYRVRPTENYGTFITCIASSVELKKLTKILLTMQILGGCGLVH